MEPPDKRGQNPEIKAERGACDPVGPGKFSSSIKSARASADPTQSPCHFDFGVQSPSSPSCILRWPARTGWLLQADASLDCADRGGPNGKKVASSSPSCSFMESPEMSLRRTHVTRARVHINNQMVKLNDLRPNVSMS